MNNIAPLSKLKAFTGSFSSLIIITLLAGIFLSSCKKTNENKSSDSNIKVMTSCPLFSQRVVALAGGSAKIGNDNAYAEESPSRTVIIEAFDIDNSEVTNAQFSEFVKATGYITDAEKVQAGFDVPGGAVFKTPTASNPSWWQFVAGANWRHPEGLETSIKNKENFPVVQVSYTDAKNYAEWKGRRLPTEAEWEYAAKGGSEELYVWGDKLVPNGEYQANTWQGAFPIDNTKQDGFFLRSPVGCFQSNNYALYDMIGNVWEWTSTQTHTRSNVLSYTIKGGSFLCAPYYCQRYRASAKQPQEADFTTNHIGFRTVQNTAVND